MIYIYIYEQDEFIFGSLFVSSSPLGLTANDSLSEH